MPAPVKTCPKCGSLVVPQLERCRTCKTYLHGTRVEGFLIQTFLPESMAKAPATFTMCLLIALYYILMIAAAGPSSALGFTSYTLRQLGATHGVSIMLGEHWRFITSFLAHHDILHIGLNMWALVYVGQLVERIFDMKKMFLIFFLTGALSMVISHIWYLYVRGQPFVVSAGASGAVCGLIGAALFGAKKIGFEAREIAQGMKRWAIFMLVWGFVVPGINNAAHIGGFVVGLGLAKLLPIGVTQSHLVQRLLSVVVLVFFFGSLTATTQMVRSLDGTPASLENDAETQTILGFVYKKGTPYRYSDQVLLWQECTLERAVTASTEDALRACELARRVRPDELSVYRILADLEKRAGNEARADRLNDVAGKLMSMFQRRR